MQQSKNDSKKFKVQKPDICEQVILKVRSLMSKSCESNNSMAFLCSNHKCRNPAIVCSKEQCQCIKKHLKCRLLRADTFLKSMLSRRKQYQERPSQWVQIIRKYIQQTIQLLSRLRASLDTFTQNYGWDATQVKLYELLNQNMTSQITGGLISMIHLKTKAYQTQDQQLANQKYYKRMWNYKYLKERVSLHEIAATKKIMASLEKSVRNIAYPGYEWLFIYLDSTDQIVRKCPLLPTNRRQKQAIAYLMKNDLTYVFDSFKNCNKFSKVTQLDLKASLHKAKKIKIVEEISNTTQENFMPRIQRVWSCFKNLTHLNLQDNWLCKIQNLDEFGQLTHLNLSENRLNKIENLDNLKKLKSLNLSNNMITYIQNLQTLPNLQNADLRGNPCSKRQGYNREPLGNQFCLKILLKKTQKYRGILIF